MLVTVYSWQYKLDEVRWGPRERERIILTPVVQGSLLPPLFKTQLRPIKYEGAA